MLFPRDAREGSVSARVYVRPFCLAVPKTLRSLLELFAGPSQTGRGRPDGDPLQGRDLRDSELLDLAQEEHGA